MQASCSLLDWSERLAHQPADPRLLGTDSCTASRQSKHAPCLAPAFLCKARGFCPFDLR